MKRITFLFLSFLLCFACFSQTTIEEYNYITKGYHIQTTSGLDMKKGYELVDVTMYYQGTINNTATKTIKGVTRKFEFKKLIRLSDNKPCALMIIYTRPQQEVNYFCIPTKESSPEIWELAIKNIERFQSEVHESLCWALMKYISNDL